MQSSTKKDPLKDFSGDERKKIQEMMGSMQNKGGKDDPMKDCQLPPGVSKFSLMEALKAKLAEGNVEHISMNNIQNVEVTPETVNIEPETVNIEPEKIDINKAKNVRHIKNLRKIPDMNTEEGKAAIDKLLSRGSSHELMKKKPRVKRKDTIRKLIKQRIAKKKK